MLDAFPFLHHQRHRDCCGVLQVKGNGKYCHAYEELDSYGEHILVEIETDSKQQRANAIVCDAGEGDFCYFSLVPVSVAASASNWESVCVSLLAAGTEIGSRLTANASGGVEKESKSDDDGVVSASEIDVAEASFGGMVGCVI